jgi:hypothetical protein
MLINSANGTTYLVEVKNSVFTNRSGKRDIVISKRASHGFMFDGNRYTTIARVAAESGEFVRHYESLPQEITIDRLQQWGFLGRKSEVPFVDVCQETAYGTTTRLPFQIRVF